MNNLFTVIYAKDTLYPSTMISEDGGHLELHALIFKI